METIRGKMSLALEWEGFRDQLAGYDHITLDLGTGDGRFVRALAGRYPQRFVIGVDACRENLHEHSRARLSNMLFVAASAQELPCEFEGLFSEVTINFPWGSLLDGLLAGQPRLMQALTSVSRPEAKIQVRLNSSALTEAGSDLETGTGIILGNLSQCGWELHQHSMKQETLKKFPSTWARRLAHGRDPRAMVLHGRRA